MVSCSINDTAIPEGNQSRIVFELTEADDNNISEADVLAFRVDINDNTKEYFAYRAQGENISDNGATNKKKFTVSLLKGGSDKFRFVVLANARKELDALGDISTSGLKQEVLKRLISHHSGKWITNKSDAEYTDIPMWGESGQISISDNTNTITGVFLIRMLARIDVAVEVPVQSKFKLKSIRVYNCNTYGHIVPNTEPAYWDGTQVLKPTLPIDPGKELGPLIYDQLTTPDIEISKDIYIYEAPAVGNNENSKATCIVIGGEYNNEGKETFYRYNFANTDGNGKITYFDIIRNHLYNVKITNVQASGYNTPQEAFNAQPINLVADVTVWAQGGLSDVIFDGQYILGVSKSEFILPMTAHTIEDTDNKLVVGTDYPDGWTVSAITDNDGNAVSWLTTTPQAGVPNVKITLNLLLTENNTSNEREANVYIKAGRMEYIVKVKQTTIANVNLSLTDNLGETLTELVFLSHVGSTVPAQQFTVSWAPITAGNQIGLTTVGLNSFNFNGGGDIITNGTLFDPSGAKTYTIQPPAMSQAEIDANPFFEKTSKVNYTVSNGTQYESKSLLLHQINYAAVPIVDANFAMDGTVQYFSIKANTSWEIEVTSDPLNIIDQLITTNGGQYEDKREEKVYFKTANYTSNVSMFSGEVTFTIKSTNPHQPFPDKTVTIKCYSGQIFVPSNTYLFPTTDTFVRSYLIPVSQANIVIPGSIGADDKLEAYFVWTDEPNHVTSIELDVAGRGSSGYVYVSTGRPQGNTVVAVKVGGVIKWSWHLWITNYDPNLTVKTLGGFQIMDRNIGTLNASPGNKYCLGTMYQWGRKDPFPTPADIASNTNEKIYNTSGEIASIPTSTSNVGLVFTVQNPLTYLIANSTWNGSVGANSWNNSGQKTVYDPCPPGWKVPPSSLWSNLNTSNFAWNGTSRGRNHSTAGWFPAVGQRGQASGSLGNVGNIGSYGSYTYGSPYVPTLDFTSAAVTYNMNYYYRDGVCIRCMKE